MTTLRLPGLDLARFIAVVGMVLVHARDVVAVDATQAAPPLLWVQAATTNRARLLFFLLAGVGVALLVRRRGPAAGVLLRRAAFLAAVGAVLAFVGWGDVVLVFYGVLFVIAVLLVRCSDRVLVAVAALVAAPGVVRLAWAPFADDTLTNVLLVLGEVVPLFCLGLVVGRHDLGRPHVLRVVAGAGLLIALPGLVLLTLTGGLDVTETQGRLEPAAALVSTAGLCLLVLAACVWAVPSGSGRARRLVVAGSMPLSLYVGHAVVFTLVARYADLGLEAATALAIGYLGAAVLAAAWWRRRRGSGPVEALMRRLTEPGRQRARTR